MSNPIDPRYIERDYDRMLRQHVEDHYDRELADMLVSVADRKDSDGTAHKSLTLIAEALHTKQQVALLQSGQDTNLGPSQYELYQYMVLVLEDLGVLLDPPITFAPASLLIT